VDKPISVAVFGALGSGKSFGIKEIAKFAAVTVLKRSPFNLSQMNSPERSYRARSTRCATKVYAARCRWYFGMSLTPPWRGYPWVGCVTSGPLCRMALSGGAGHAPHRSARSLSLLAVPANGWKNSASSWMKIQGRTRNFSEQSKGSILQAGSQDLSISWP